jgi:sterol desaturase/sphingolipid hydroxylase (fatty acid hydroxylase superfamily)
MANALLGYGHDVLRVSVWLVILAVIFVPLERLFSERRQLVVRPQVGADLGYYLLNGVVTVGILGSVLAMAATLIYRFEPASIRSFAAGLQLWARIPATMIVGEFGFYWGHRLAHEIPVLWRFHAIHHSAVHVDWLTNTRAHPVDLMLPRLLGFSLIYAVGLAQFDVSPAGAVVPLVALVTVMWGFFVHANVRWRFGWLEWIVATPAFHRWHHVVGEHQDMNYAAMLPVFDYMFGTLHLPPREMPKRYGCDTPMPADIVGQLASPFASAARGPAVSAPRVAEAPRS